jgi:uncharacterized membrane protein YadS
MNTLRLLPSGLILALLLGFCSLWVAHLPAVQSIGFSALTIAIVGGMILGNTAYPMVAKPCHEGSTLPRPSCCASASSCSVFA